MAANNSDRPIVSQCFMNLKVEGNSVKIPFLVIDLNCRDIILGVSFLTRTKLILNSSDRMFCLKHKPFLSLIKPHMGEKEIKHDIDNLIKNFPEVLTDKIGKALNLSVAEGYKCCKFFLNPVTLHKVKNTLREWSEQGITV